jgi:hypothetical protein
MADYTPVYEGGATPFTATTSGAVVGGRVLAVSGNGTVAHAGANVTTFVGVAAHDAPSGGRVAGLGAGGHTFFKNFKYF